jgi:hypothetical protein
MDTDKGRTVHRLVRWLKDKIEKRKDEREDHDPWWVTLMLDVGRPAVAVMILIMCAPGEHYLGVMAGWTRGMAWLTPASLTAYAGISAVVATKRPKGAPGRNTAVWGAILSILLAMGAQPVAHLYEQHLITGHRFVLTIVVSVIPAAVFGHLLHMGAATPKPVRRHVSRPDRKRMDKILSKPKWLTDNEAAASAVSMSVSGLMDAPDSPPDAMTWTGDADTDKASRTPRRMANGSMRTVALSKIMDNPEITDDEIKDAILDRFGQDSKTNSVWRSIKRAREDWDREQAS